LHASLMARLDRLGPAKEIAQIGAAIGREFSHAVLAAVVRKPEAELRSALDRLIGAGLLFRLGVPPNASYLFKHALVQDAAYGTLLRDSRRALHALVAETLETDFADIAERQPELLAHHFTEAEQLEKAARLWGKAGLRSLERSALIEAAEQITRALAQIARSASEPALRREEIKLQLAFSNAVMLTKGYAAPETKAAFERASALIERAQALGEAPEDPLTLFSVLYGFWVVNLIAFNGEAMRELAGQFLALAEKQSEIVPLMIGHRLMGTSLVFTGDIAEGRAHYDQAIALYDPAVHRPLATRFGHDVGVVILCQRSFALWHLGYPESALADADYAVRDARELGHAATLMYALCYASSISVLCRKYAAANALLDEVIALAEEKGASFWRAYAMTVLGRLLIETGKALAGRQMIASGIVGLQSTGGTVGLPLYLCNLAYANSELGNYEEAWRCIGEALTVIETTKQTLNNAEVHYVAGEIALKSSEETKAVAHLEQAIAVARAQQARSIELRATMSMARLWRDQGKRQQAQDLLAPVYGWFTEGFDTLDLKEAKALLDELAS
jgi:predicted ATPase